VILTFFITVVKDGLLIFLKSQVKLRHCN